MREWPGRGWWALLLIRLPSPPYTWAQVKAPGGGGGARFREPPFRLARSPTGLDPQRWEGARTRRGGRRRPRLASSAFVAAAPGLPGSLTAAAAAP